MRGRLAGRVHLPQAQWWAAQGAPLARAGYRGRGPLCTLAAALFHDIRQAGAVECLEEVVNPLALVTARVEARRRGGLGALELAAAALLRSELRARLLGQLLRLREIMGGHWRSREITGDNCGGRGKLLFIRSMGGGVGRGAGLLRVKLGAPRQSRR